MTDEQKKALVDALKTNPAFQTGLGALGTGPLPSTDPQLAIDINWLLQQLPALIPLLITLFTGGSFPAALIPIIIQIIAKLFNISASEAQALVKA